jgi:6-phosphogluconolactonase (cycloisomerase 2 family)
MKFRFLAVALVLISFCFLPGCGSNFSSPSNGFIFVATQGDSSVSSFAIDLSNGSMTAINKPVSVQASAQSTAVPQAMVMAASGSSLYGVNTDGAVWSLPINTDGTMGAATFANQGAGPQAQDIVVDAGGKFLFVANQGTPSNIASGTISVFSVSGSGLTQVGSPVSVAIPGATMNPGPTALALTADAKFLYVANTFDSSVAVFAVDSSGNLTSQSSPTSVPGTVGISPSGLTISPDGTFLYVATFGTNEISAFLICDKSVNTCTDVNNPDGKLTAVSNGFPASAGLGPTRMTIDPSGPYLFAVGQQSNQILGYKMSPGSAALTALAPPSVSTGTTPIGVVTRSGTTINGDGSTEKYLFVANSGGASISSFSYESTNGALNVGPTITTAGQPVAIVVK